jgi:hypothetical protein
MANAVIGDVGDVMTFATGQDLTGWDVLEVFIRLPDGTQLTKNDTTNAVNDGGVPSAGNIYYPTEADVILQDGELYCSARFTIDDGVFSQPTPGVYTVRRRNQVPE